MTSPSRFLLGAVSALCACASMAGDAYVPVSVPSEFRTRLTHSAERVVYAQSSGEWTNLFDRPAIEGTCKTMRELGGTDKTPVFEEGYDKPSKTEKYRFTNDSHSADMNVEYGYACVGFDSKPNTPDAPCACTYRVQTQYFAHIKNRLPGGRMEILHIDFSRGEATRRITAAPPTLDPESIAAIVGTMAPEVVGRDVVAGIPCVIRRQHMGPENYVDRCVTDDPDKKLPPELRNRTLSEHMPLKGGKGTFSSMRTDKVVLNALVNSGVFAVPEGITVKEIK